MTIPSVAPHDPATSAWADAVAAQINANVRVSSADYAPAAVYRPLATLPIDSAGNLASLIINGRLGGWVGDNDSAQWSIFMANRSDSSGYSGDHISSAVIASGGYTAGPNQTDIVVYKQTDKSALVYLKLQNYYAYDFSIAAAYQATMSYDGSGSTTTPPGTLIWSLSTANYLGVNTDGLVYLNGVPLATRSYADSAKVSGSDAGTPAALTLWKGTQAQYNAIGTKDNNTVYAITP